MEIISKAETFATLRDTWRDLKPLAVKGSSYGFTDNGLTFFDYSSYDFIIGINTSKTECVGFTWFDRKSGSVMSFEYAIKDTGASKRDPMYCTMLSDNVCSIYEAGVHDLD